MVDGKVLRIFEPDSYDNFKEVVRKGQLLIEIKTQRPCICNPPPPPLSVESHSLFYESRLVFPVFFPAPLNHSSINLVIALSLHFHMT